VSESLRMDITQAGEVLRALADDVGAGALRDRLTVIIGMVDDLHEPAADLRRDLEHERYDHRGTRDELDHLEIKVESLTSWSSDDVAMAAACATPADAVRAARETVEVLRRSAGQSGTGGMLADLVEILADQAEAT